jgi:hypothetical protein
MNTKLISALVALSCALAFAACKSETSTGTGGVGGGGYGGDPYAGGNGGQVAAGDKTCNYFLNNDAASSSWATNVADYDFVSTTAWNAYDALNACACVDALPNGCANICTQDTTNPATVPNFCDAAAGKTPNQNSTESSCYGCLQLHCAAQLADCSMN